MTYKMKIVVQQLALLQNVEIVTVSDLAKYKNSLGL